MAEEMAAPAAPVTAPDTSAETTAPAEGEPGTDGGEAAAEDPAPAAGGLVTVKVDGQEMQVTEQEVRDGYIRQRTFTKRMQELAEQRKGLQQVLGALQDNRAGEVLAKLGPQAVRSTLASLVQSQDPAVAKEVNDFFAEMLAYDKLPPEERARREIETDRQRLAREKKEWEDARSAEQLEAKTAQRVKTYTSWFTDALGGQKLPATPHTITRMTLIYQSLLEGGARDGEATAAEAAKVARAEYVEEQKALLASSDPDSLLELLGPQAVAAIRQREVAKVVGRGNGAPQEGAPPKKPKVEAAPITTEQLRALRAARRRGA